MFPTPNYILRCIECGKELTVCQDEEFPQLDAVLPKCPNCGGEMVENPIVHGGPFHESPFKKY
jgi:hypothetical protein